MLSLSIKAFMRLLLSYCKIVCFTIAFIIFCLNIKCVVADVHEVSDKDLMKVFSNKDIYFSKNKKLTFIKSSVLQKHINHHTTISNAFNLNFSKINIINLVSKISKIMNKNFIISGLDNLSKHVSIIVTAMPLTFVQVWNVFQSALCANSLSLVKVGDFYKITSILHVKKPLKFIELSDCLPFNENIITYVYKIKHISKSSMHYLVKSLLTNNGKLTFINDNLLVVNDIFINVYRIINILKKIDIPNISARIHFVTLIHANAEYVCKKLKEIFIALKQNRQSSKIVNSSNNCFVNLFNIQKIIADQKTNKLIIVASDFAFMRMKEIISMLDVSFSSELCNGRIHVYPLKHHDAKKISITLSLLSDSLKKTKKSILNKENSLFKVQNLDINLFNGKIKIKPDISTNSLIIVANSKDFKSLKKVIDKLDKEKVKVYVEAAILDVSLRYNEYININMFGRLQISGKQESITSIINPDGKLLVADFLRTIINGNIDNSNVPITNMLGMVEYLGRTINIGGQNIPSVGVVLNSLQNFSNIDLLSTQSMIALDNDKAEISAITRIPLNKKVDSVDNDNTNKIKRSPNSIDYEDIKLNVSIIPHVNSIDQIKLEIEQKVSDLDYISVFGETKKPVINIKSSKTTIVVKDQQTIIIGGLITYKIKAIENRIPILSDIPIIGWLFKSWKEEKEKSNLLIMMTPYLIKTQSDYHKIYLRKLIERKKFNYSFLNN